MIEAFRVLSPPPDAPPCPVIVEIPHAGVHVDAETLGFSVAPLYAVGRDADLYVDRIFSGAVQAGATVLLTPMSRFVVDLNRDPTDYDGITVEGGPDRPRPRGLVWRKTTDGDPLLLRRLTAEELERRMRTLYRPYHEQLVELIAAKQKLHPHVAVVCAHSMPSTGRRGHIDVGEGRADVVPGTRGHTSARADLIAVVEQACRAHSLSFKHDDPYRGGFSTGHYGRPSEGVSAIQIELARRLYMDETTLQPDTDGLARVQSFALDLVRSLVRALNAASSAG